PCAGSAGRRRAAGLTGPAAAGASTPQGPAAGADRGRLTVAAKDRGRLTAATAGRGRLTAATAAGPSALPRLGNPHPPLLTTLPRTLISVPFTLGYTLVLLGTGLYARLGDPGTVHDLLADSSTDVSHLSQRPLLTLLVSALWVVGGITSPYLVVFPLVLGALERRIGGVRTAGVFLLGHVLATLLTELPVAASVAVGHLPDSSLRRLDYGVSYGLIACAAALAGLLVPRLRWALLGGIGLALAAGSLVDFDPLTEWGHGLALLIGIVCWPYVRRNARWRPSSKGSAAAGGGFAHSERAPGNT
ncbi:rhomboid-like protein, partial [Streptomyces yatensis]